MEPHVSSRATGADNGHQPAGFTVLEILVVMVLLAILAATAVPRYGETREGPHFAVITSDFKNFGLAQAEYRGAHATYALDLAHLRFQGSQGVELSVTEATATGWAAVGTHQALPADQGCAVYLGDAEPPVLPDGSPHELGAGVVECRR